MRRRLIVLRPEPGNAATCRRIAAVGALAVSLPLFAVRPTRWTPPDPGGFDALFLTSANAVRHAGPALARYRALPVVAVGDATAEAARAAGLTVVATGARDAAAATELLERSGLRRPLHLTGREHRAVAGATSVVVYASDPVEPGEPLADLLANDIALVHSPRAGARLDALVPAADRSRIAVAAISAAALASAGSGWADGIAAPTPDDAALIAAALSIDPPPGGGDKST